MLSDLNWSGHPRKFFKEDLITKINKLKHKYRSSLKVWILCDWNKECHTSSTTNDFCKEFGLVNVFD